MHAITHNTDQEIVIKQPVAGLVISLQPTYAPVNYKQLIWVNH